MVCCRPYFGDVINEEILGSAEFVNIMAIRQFNNKYEIFFLCVGYKKKTGKPLITQIMEIVSLKYGTNKLSAGEHYGYGLYDNSRYTSEKKRSFLGNQLTNRLDNIVNAVNWRALDQDKIVFAALMKGLGFQQPTLYAFYGPGHRHLSVSQFREPEEMAAFLRDGIVYPFFAKPVASLGAWVPRLSLSTIAPKIPSYSQMVIGCQWSSTYSV